MTEAGWIAPGDTRIGVLGGTFDPIHFGHLAIAEQVREALSLDRVLFVPAARPPHRLASDVTPAADRAAMVALAIADNTAFSLCRIELDRDGPSYTSDTVAALADEADLAARADEAARELFFILSSEALVGFAKWHEPDRILASCRLAVVPRPGTPLPARAWLESHLPGGATAADRVDCVETVPLANSASGVRLRVSQGLSVRYLVPPAVETYICDHRLYTQPANRRTA